MKLRRESDGSYLVLYDGSKKELLALAEHLQNIAHAGVGNDFSLFFQGIIHNFQSPRELFFFGYALMEAIRAPFIEKLETHLSSIVQEIYQIPNVQDIDIEDDDSP